MNISTLCAGTAFIIYFSWWLSIRYKRYHGIARFFVFESIFILLMMNWKIWFHDFFSPLQIVSWILLFGSLYFAVAGFIILKSRGKPTINFENTSRLVRSGLYGYIRHPLYLSLFMGGTGIMLKNPGKIQVILAVINTVGVYLTSRIEEGEMIARFGDEYRQYMKETKMFVPGLI